MSTVPHEVTELHGFRVELGIGPYPPDAPLSHRKAIYAWLTPATVENARKMRRQGKTAIQAFAELSQELAKAIEEDPLCIEADAAAAAVLKKAAPLAKLVNEA